MPPYIYKTLAYGGEPKTPDIQSLTAFLHEHHEYTKRHFDLTSYQLAVQIRAEKKAEIEIIGSGGLFLKSRIDEAVCYDEEWHLCCPNWLLYDAEMIQFLSKQSQYSIPAPNYVVSEEEDESYYSLCEQYQMIMRNMRDAGIYRHVLIATHVDEIFCEELIGRRVSVLMTRDAKEKDIECLLEYQHNIALYDSSRLESLLDQYSLSTVTLIDPTESDLEIATELLDEDKILIGGYNDPENEREKQNEEEVNNSEWEYWNKIKEKARGQFQSHR